MPLTDTHPQIHHDVFGDSGTPVLLVMGFGMRGALWYPQVQTLQDQHRVATYDHPGIGQSPPGPRYPTMQLMAGHAQRLLDHLGWDRAHIVGVSMGGMIAQNLVLEAPERVRSLSLIATHAGGIGAWVPTLSGLRQFVKANRGSGERRVRALQELLYPAAYLETVDKDVMRQRMSGYVAKRAPRETLLGHMYAVSKHATERRLKAVTAPTLIVKPSLDILVRPGHSDRIHARIPGSRLLTFDDAGHGVTFQKADELNAALLEHFARAEAAEAPSVAA